MKKLFITLLFVSSVFSNDVFFKMVYNGSTHMCELYKDGKKVDLNDTRPIDHVYNCLALKKEHYNSCMQYDKENLAGAMISYGVYPGTNTLMAFFAANKDKDAHLTIRCTHTLKDIFKK